MHHALLYIPQISPFLNKNVFDLLVPVIFFSLLSSKSIDVLLAIGFKTLQHRSSIFPCSRLLKLGFGVFVAMYSTFRVLHG